MIPNNNINHFIYNTITDVTKFFIYGISNSILNSLNNNSLFCLSREHVSEVTFSPDNNTHMSYNILLDINIFILSILCNNLFIYKLRESLNDTIYMRTILRSVYHIHPRMFYIITLVLIRVSICYCNINIKLSIIFLIKNNFLKISIT